MLILLFGAVGCAGRLPRVEVLGGTEVRVCKVAVIPFKNESANPVVARMLYRLLLSKMVAEMDFDVVEEGAIRSFMMYEHIMPGQFFSFDLVRLLRERTGAQAVVEGRVIEAEERGGKVVLSYFLWMKDTLTGRLLWSVYHRRTGEDYRRVLHFGKVSLLSELADRMLDETLSELRKKGLKGCGR